MRTIDPQNAYPNRPYYQRELEKSIAWLRGRNKYILDGAPVKWGNTKANPQPNQGKPL